MLSTFQQERPTRLQADGAFSFVGGDRLWRGMPGVHPGNVSSGSPRLVGGPVMNMLARDGQIEVMPIRPTELVVHRQETANRYR